MTRNKHWDGPESLDRMSSKCYVNKKLTKAAQARIDARIKEAQDKQRAEEEARRAAFRRPKKKMTTEVKEKLRAKRPERPTRPASLVAHVADIAKQAGLDPREARGFLRKSKFKKSAFGWWFTKNEAKDVLAWFKKQEK
jgi:hypothetical protein